MENLATRRQNLAIAAYGLSKRYALSERGLDRLRLMQPGRRDVESHQALRDVSLEVRPGESCGIIGRNGAGKSTLLRLIAGITEPDTGEVTVNGRLLSVIGPAAGMKPELTGRENLRIRAAVLGMNQEQVAERLPDIVAFADIGDYIDRPMRTYSAGMRARLGFAVNFAFQPDVLLVDETLAGGDNDFRQKVLARVAAIREAGASLVLVSHSAHMMSQFCDRAILLERGENLLQDTPKVVNDAYQRLLAAADEDYAQTVSDIRHREGAGAAPVDVAAETTPAVPATGGAGQETGCLTQIRRGPTYWRGPEVGASISELACEPSPTPPATAAYPCYRFRMTAHLQQLVRTLSAQAVIKTEEGIRVAACRLEPEIATAATCEPGHYRLVGTFENRLQAGLYTVDAVLRADTGNERLTLHVVRDALQWNCVGPFADERSGVVDLTVVTPPDEYESAATDRSG